MRAKPTIRRKSRKVVLTERDMILFDALLKFGFMTRDQIQSYFDWACVSDINRRLRKLYDAEYVDRRFLPRTFGSTPAVYSLGSEGASVLVREQGCEEQELNRRRHRSRKLSDNRLPHELLITEFACLLRAATARYPSCGLIDWRYDDLVAEKCNAVESVADRQLKPDAFGSYHIGRSMYNFFLEADLGTESLPRIQKKVELYRAFKSSGHFQANFGKNAFRLLIVTNSRKRSINISKLLTGSPDLKIFVGAVEELRIDPLFGSVWRVPTSSSTSPQHIVVGSNKVRII